MDTKTQMRLVLPNDLKTKLVEMAQNDRRSQTNLICSLIEKEYNQRFMKNDSLIDAAAIALARQ